MEKGILLRLINRANPRRNNVIIVVSNFILAIVIIGLNIYIRSFNTIRINMVDGKQAIEVIDLYADYYEIISFISLAILLCSLFISIYVLTKENKRIYKRLNFLVGLFDEVGLSKIESDNKILTDYDMQVIEAWNRSVAEIDYLNELREKYFKNMVHDLKSPIQVLSMNIEMMKLAAPDDEFVIATEEELKILEESVRNYLLIEKITFFEKVEKENINIDEYFKHIINRYSKLNYKININHSSKIEEIYTDRTMFNRIVENLIDNGIKYGADLKINIIIDNETIVFTNKLEQQKEILDIFSKSRQYSVMGNGLGVEIINTYIKLLGWKIDSKTIGNEFVVTIKYN